MKTAHACAGARSRVECRWPYCGCDAEAERVVVTLIEDGWRSPEGYALMERIAFELASYIPPEAQELLSPYTRQWVRQQRRRRFLATLNVKHELDETLKKLT
jgi:hypothetical protein